MIIQQLLFKFGLHALQLGRKSIASPGPKFAIGDVTGQARATSAATNCCGHHHRITHFDPGDAAADLNHFADRLVPNTEADVVAEAVAAIDVQIAAADRTPGHLDNRVVFALDPRIIHRLVPYVARTAIAQRLHSVSPPSTTTVCPVT